MALISTSLGGVGGATASDAFEPAVLRDWNATMVATVVVDAGKAKAEASLVRFRSAGDVQRGRRHHPWVRAVRVGQARPAQPHRRPPQPRPRTGVLLHYFPASQSRLDTRSLHPWPRGGWNREQQGITYGEAAADRVIALRLNDGRNTPSRSTKRRRRASGGRRPGQRAVLRAVAQPGPPMLLARPHNSGRAPPALDLRAIHGRSSTRSRRSGRRTAPRGPPSRPRRRCSSPTPGRAVPSRTARLTRGKRWTSATPPGCSRR